MCIHSEVIAARDVCAVFWKEKDADEVSSDSESGGRVTIRETLKGKFACAPMAAFKNNVWIVSVHSSTMESPLKEKRMFPNLWWSRTKTHGNKFFPGTLPLCQGVLTGRYLKAAALATFDGTQCGWPAQLRKDVCPRTWLCKPHSTRCFDEAGQQSWVCIYSHCRHDTALCHSPKVTCYLCIYPHSHPFLTPKPRSKPLWEVFAHKHSSLESGFPPP